MTGPFLHSSGAGGTLGGARSLTTASGGGIAASVVDLQQRVVALELGTRSTQLGYSSVHGRYVQVFDNLGNLRLQMGMQNDARYAVTYANGDPPPEPNAPICVGADMSVVVYWDGTFAPDADENVVEAPSDLRRIDVHVSTDPEFEVSGQTVISSLPAEGVTTFFRSYEPQYVRLVAVSTSDVPSEATAPVGVQPNPVSVLAAHTVGADQLVSDLILSSTIFAGDPNAGHVEINNTGLSVYDTDGITEKVVFDTNGNALITGVIQTAPPGSGVPRIVFNSSVDVPAIAFASADETSYCGLYAAGDTDPHMLARGPLADGQATLTVLDLARSYLSLGEIMADTGAFQSVVQLDPYSAVMEASNVQFNASYNVNGTGGTHLAQMAVGFVPGPGNPTVNPTTVMFYTEAITSLANYAAASGVSFGWPGMNMLIGINSTGGYVEAYNSTTGALAPWYASTIATSSSREIKENIRALDREMLPGLREVQAVHYKFLDVPASDIADPTHTDVAEHLRRRIQVPERISRDIEIGLIAEDVQAQFPEAVQEAPSGVLCLKLDTMTAILWQAMQETDSRLDAAEARLTALEAAITTTTTTDGGTTT